MDDDWEEWNPQETSFKVHVLAGSVAGLAEHIAMFPFDTIKTHLQTRQSRHSVNFSILSELRMLMQHGGIKGLFRGMSSVIYGTVPAHAAYFSVYEASKKYFHLEDESGIPFLSALSGSLATMSHDLILTPLDVVKQRLQLGYYSGFLDSVRTIASREGLRALFVSFPLTLVMNIPQGGVLVATNETIKRHFNPSGEYNFPVFLGSGVVSGALSGLVTTPLDVIKTRLQTQTLKTRIFSSSPPPSPTPSTPSTPPSPTTIAVRGFSTIVRQIYVESGYVGFMRGALPRMLLNAPAAAISWTTYETMKKLLSDM